MANVDNPHGFKFHTCLFGGVIPIWSGKAKSNAKWGAGDVLFASAGYITSVETTDKAPVGVAVGYQQSNSAAARPTAYFYPNIEGVVFKAQEDGTPTQADIWTIDDYLLTGPATNVSTSAQEVDTTGGDATLLRIGFDPNTSIGANSEVLVTFLKSKFTGKTSSTNVGA